MVITVHGRAVFGVFLFSASIWMHIPGDDKAACISLSSSSVAGEFTACSKFSPSSYFLYSV